jgi:hypothetical protein
LYVLSPNETVTTLATQAKKAKRLTMEPEEQVEYKIQRLNLLAFPRDANPVCELTGARASVELVTQYLTL